MNRLSTGVPGLDVALGGGLEAGSTTVLAGTSGTGKTILAQQICFTNATAEHHAIYYTTISEPHAKMMRHLEPFDFFRREMLGPMVEFLHLGDLIRHDPSGRLEPLFSEVMRKTMEEQPILVVIDSAKALRDFTTVRDLRVALYDLTSRMAHTETALLLLGEYGPDEIENDAEFSLADNIVQLAFEPREPLDRRWLRVLKARGVKHLSGKHTLRIGTGGLEVFPRTETLGFGAAAEGTGRIHSGIPGLDEVMGGGIGRTETTAVLGPSGVSKTIFGLHFVVQGLAEQGRCLYFSFQDTSVQLVRMAGAFGWELDTAIADGRLVIHHVPSGELDLDVLAARIREELASGDVHRIVIDSLAEMVAAAREAERFPAFARGLAGIVRCAGAALVITSEMTTLGPTAEPLGGVMFLFHNVILLRYIEHASTTGRALNVVKMRNSHHSQQLHELHIGDHGLVVGPGLKETAGVLGWSALRAPEIR